MEFIKRAAPAALAALLAIMSFAGCDKDKDNSVKTGGDLVPSAGATVAKPGEDPVWIRVNGKEIKKSDVDDKLAKIKMQISSQVPPDQMAGLEPRLLRDTMMMLVEVNVLDEAVAANGITVGDTAIDKEMEDLKSRYPDEATFQEQMTMVGVTEDQIREDIRLNFGRMKYLEEHVDIPDPPEEDVKKIYEMTKDRNLIPASAKTVHIFFQFPNMAAPEVKTEKLELAKSVLEQIKNGADMGELAKKYSDAPSKSDGGTETFEQGRLMPPDFDNALFALKAGEVSDVIESPIGYHIVKMVELTPEKPHEFEEVKEEIVEFLKDQKRKSAMQQHIDELVKKAKVEYLEPLPKVEDDFVDQMNGLPPPEVPEGEGEEASEAPMESEADGSEADGGAPPEIKEAAPPEAEDGKPTLPPPGE